MPDRTYVAVVFGEGWTRVSARALGTVTAASHSVASACIRARWAPGACSPLRRRLRALPAGAAGPRLLLEAPAADGAASRPTELSEG